MGIGKYPQTIKPSLDEFDFSQSEKTQKNTSKTAANEIFDAFDQDMLDKNFRAKCFHSLSQLLPVNKITQDFKVYIEKNKCKTKVNKTLDFDTAFEKDPILKETYKKYERFLLSYNDARNSIIAKDMKLNDEIEGNVGWKLHINILPEDVITVSEYLTKEGYNHKFLSGGDLENGKVFTIYVGSYMLTKKVAEKISHDIKKYLCKPEDQSEIEFAPGVIGRFRYESKIGDDRKSAPYGTCGFSVDQTLKSLGVKKMELISYRRLKSKFGEYFYE